MLKARITLDKDFTVAQVDKRLFGSFVEHLGRCIYGGLYEPEHRAADEHGFRTDVLELTRELDVPVVRWPGGNFVSGYHWIDGVGPKAGRPRRAEPAWKAVETNRFGTDEFVDWCRAARTEPLITVNLGTGTPEEAAGLVEYCNLPGGTHLSDLRRRNGHAEPHGVKVWCLGNEMDGPWQMGCKTAEEYGRIANQAARLMKMIDPAIELVVCGTCGRGLPTFGTWDWEVLGATFDVVEYLSIHAYYGNRDDDTPDFLSKPEEMGQFIEEAVALCDAAAARRKSNKRIQISFDEWNVWNSKAYRHAEPPPWTVAPAQLECVYTMEDALVVGGMLIQLLNHCDRVKIACQAQLVNVIGLMMTETGGGIWRQSICWPFLHASRFGRGTVLRQVVETPRYDAKGRKDVPVLTSAAVRDEGAGGVTIFAVNRSLTEPLALTVDLRAFGELKVQEWTVLRHDDLKAVNGPDCPDVVRPARSRGAAVKSGTLAAKLPAASWNVIRLAAAET